MGKPKQKTLTQSPRDEGVEPKVIDFGEISRTLGREKTKNALNVDYLGAEIDGCIIRIENIDWTQYNNKIYAIVKAWVEDTHENCPEGEQYIAFAGKVATDKLKLIEKYVKDGYQVRALVWVKTSRTGRKYLDLVDASVMSNKGGDEGDA